MLQPFQKSPESVNKHKIIRDGGERPKSNKRGNGDERGEGVGQAWEGEAEMRAEMNRFPGWSLEEKGAGENTIAPGLA
jgi:hypothetical protein